MVTRYLLFSVFFLFIEIEQVDRLNRREGNVVFSCMKEKNKRNSRFENAAIENMVLIPGGEYLMGSSGNEGRPDEYPQHTVKVKDFWMDETEVTNAEFREFVEATGYITTAEQKPDWEELKKQLPPNTPKPSEDVLVPASLVFRPGHHSSPHEWWQWTNGANWKQPQGEGSSIKGKDDYPVVHISWYDANAYAKWAGKRLPTEAEWERAARAGFLNKTFPWGDGHADEDHPMANIWQGHFPDSNTHTDDYERTAPVKSYQPNKYGLYDMAGNVWEWCSDWYDADYYKKQNENVTFDPMGPDDSYDPEEPAVKKKVIRGGSFLCHDSYCSGYRVSARMKVSPDTGLEHTGFRCVKDK